MASGPDSGEHGVRRRETPWLVLRDGAVGDLEAVAEMAEDFVQTHPAASHPRSISKLRTALFGDAPVSQLVVACRRGRVVGMVQWNLFYDMFWSMFGGRAEWLYVRPEVRGLGVAAALVAEVCARIRGAGGEFLHGSGDGEAAALYERFAHGWPARECALGAEAFQVVADLAGAPVREIVRGLPARELHKVPARPRGG